MQQWAVRIPDDLAKAIDKRAQSVELSRNAWIAKALQWAVDQPVRTTTKTEKL